MMASPDDGREKPDDGEERRFLSRVS